MLALFIVSIPAQEAEASRLWDFVYKRYLKRSKLKKLVPRLLGKEIALEDLEIRGDYEVIGYEPAWLVDKGSTWDDKKKYYFNLLTTLVCGEYDINPVNGEPRNEKFLYQPIRYKVKDSEEKIDLSIYQKARLKNPRINLMITLSFSHDFGDIGMQPRYESDLFHDDEIFNNLRRELAEFFAEVNIALDKKNDKRLGILIDFDFERMDTYKDGYIEFLQKLRDAFPDKKLYLKLPPLIRNGSAYPHSFIKDIISKEDELIDMFIMEAYGFEKSASDRTSTCKFDPDSPYSVESSVNHYKNFDIEENENISLEDLQKMFDEKLVIEFPYFEAKWDPPPGRNMPYTLRKSNTYLTFDDFWTDHVGKKGKTHYSHDSMSLYCETMYIDKPILAYGEDSTTFFRKMSYIVDSLQLRGIGLNSIGYYLKSYNVGGKKIPTVWRAYANTDSELTKKKESFGWIVAYFIVAFIPIGFVFSVGYYWQVRNALAKHKKYYNRFLAFFGLFVFAWLVVADILPRGTVGLILGLILVLFLLIYILIKKVIIRSKKYVNALK